MNYLKTWFEKFNYLYLMFDIITNVDSDNKFKIREPNSNVTRKNMSYDQNIYHGTNQFPK